jgi:hypothetical protein
MKSIPKKPFLFVALALGSGLIVAGFLIGPVLYRVYIGFQRYEIIAPALPADLGENAILVFSKTNGFRHEEAIAAANAALAEIARQHGWSVMFTENGAVFGPGQLHRFKAVIWNNTSGDLLTEQQRAAFKSYIENGGGFVGIHGAGGDPHYDWQWYVQTLIGAQFKGHPMDPQLQKATIHINDRDDPITRGLPETWIRVDEWYSFEKSPAETGVHVIATLDERTYHPFVFGRYLGMGGDHPIIWKHCVGNGPVFYSALGHTAASYQEPEYVELLSRAIAWTMGFGGSKCSQGTEIP